MTRLREIHTSRQGNILQFFFLVCFSMCHIGVKASTPNAYLSIPDEDLEWMVKRGEFGTEDRVEGRLVHSPSVDQFLCEFFNVENENNRQQIVEHDESWIMMVPRGYCAFERKLYAAKIWYGAKGIIVYDNLNARYRNGANETNVNFPIRQTDFECERGSGVVYNIELDPPLYNPAVLDPILDMQSPVSNCTLGLAREPCESQLCLVTGPAREGSSAFPVCCAWDLLITMGASEDDSEIGNTDDVAAVSITIRQGQEVLPFLGQLVVIKPRPNPPFNISQIFLWIMAVLITLGAAHFSASDLRIFRAKLARYQDNRETIEVGGDPSTDEPVTDRENIKELPQRSASIDTADFADMILGLDDLESDDENDGEEQKQTEENEQDMEMTNIELGNAKTKTSKGRPAEKNILKSLSPKGKTKEKDHVWTLHSLPPPEKKKAKEKKKKPRPGYKAEHTEQTSILPTDGRGAPIPQPWATPIGGFEMTQWHVVGFIVLASAMLFLLFYFRFYAVVFVLYGIGCAGSVSHLIFGPLLVRVVPKFGNEVVKELNKKVVCGLNGLDVTSQLLGFVWAIVWIWYGMSHYRPSTNAFFWISINIFGACFCVLALSMIKLGGIKIATLLLIAVFLYDIFFVFITPLFLDGQSIMITVAQGGGGNSLADDFCYKYPEDKQCTGIDFLPMLLVVPRFNDFLKGSALLGLGDIVLPGYLIAFGARLDEAKRIIGKHTSRDMEFSEKWYQGYFFWLMIAYSVGLVLAFVAFGITGVGQPALLYLVPCCLGMVVVMGRKELKDLWTGARALRLTLKLKEKCERAWGKEAMRREVVKLKEERGEQNGTIGAHPYRAIPIATQQTSPLNEEGRDARKAAAGQGRNKTSGGASSMKNPAHNKKLKSPVASGETGDGDGYHKNDIRFGDPKCTGTKHLRTVVKRELLSNPDVEFGPQLLESIDQRLCRRHFYIKNGSNSWRMATSSEVTKEISKIFHAEHSKLKQKRKCNEDGDE